MAARRTAFACLAVAAVLLAPLAESRPQPVLYFLKDAEVSPGHRLPIGDGELSLLPPPPLPNPQDPTNATRQPSSRVIFPYVSAVTPTQFVANASANTGRIAGVVLAYLVLPKSPALQQATLNISLVELPKDPQVPPPLGGGGRVIAWARLPLDYQNTTLPNATSWVPPNATDDPQAAVNYTAAQVLGYGLTTVASAGALVILDDATDDYLVDTLVDPQARLALRLVLENGTGQPPVPSAPLPVGAGQTILYDFAFAYSLVLVPWYAPDPPASTTTTTPKAPTTTTTGPGKSGTTTTTDSKESIALPFGILLAVLVTGVLATRRRLL